jgi:hypothetical protein
MNWFLKFQMLKKLFAWAQGRTTAFALMFFISGTTMAWFHRLDATYVAFCGTLMGAVIGHSIKEDIFDSKKPDDPNPSS